MDSAAPIHDNNGHIHPPGHFCGSNCPEHRPDAASAQAKAQQIQRGLEPAETIPQLVDAIRQDTAGIGACVSSIRFIASARGGDVPKSVLAWVDRLAAHAERLEGKCALALNRRTA